MFHHLNRAVNPIVVPDEAAYKTDDDGRCGCISSRGDGCRRAWLAEGKDHRKDNKEKTGDASTAHSGGEIIAKTRRLELCSRKKSCKQLHSFAQEGNYFA
jgi:hypothetical protein